MYVWSDTDQKFKDARIIFTDTEKSNWTWDDTAKAFYWHRFFSHQPDLNYDSPLVMEEVLKAMRFWLDMGVDGLRLDAIPYLVERDGTNCENLPETHAAVKKLRAAIDESYANRLILAEANQWPADVRPYFGDGDECHMAFHFPLMPRIYMALRQEDRLPITDIMAQTPSIPDNCQWGLFLRNHDELTLEMVTDDERDYMMLAYSADPRMRVNVGIRRRLAPLVDNNRRRIELLNSILFSFPGTPILYYGDEIGMGDNIYLGDRNGVRTPMQWTSDRNAGFSKCDPARLYFPVIMDPIYGYQVVNVEAQLSDQSSLLHWTRNMIALRKLFQVFGRGSLTFLNPSNRKILAYLRDLDLGDGTHETVLCVANLSRFAQPVELDLSGYAGMEPVEMLGYVPFPADRRGAVLAVAGSVLVFVAGAAAARSPAGDALPEPAEAGDSMWRKTSRRVLDLLTKGWAGFLAGHGLDAAGTGAAGVAGAAAVVRGQDAHHRQDQAAGLGGASCGGGGQRGDSGRRRPARGQLHTAGAVSISRLITETASAMSTRFRWRSAPERRRKRLRQTGRRACWRGCGLRRGMGCCTMRRRARTPGSDCCG